MNLELRGEDLFQAFLAEVQALDDFRAEYARRYDFEGLGRDDQDVRRLIEAMAFYCARTRGGVERAMHRYKLQALEQLFPYLLSPMPAMALLYPVLSSNVTETRLLRRSAEVRVAASDVREQGSSPDPAAEAPPRLFRALGDLRVFPLYIVERSVRLVKHAQGSGSEPAGAASPPFGTLHLTIAPSPRGARERRFYDDPRLPLEELVLQLNPQGDVLLALRVFDALEQSCRRVDARFYSEGVPRHELVCRRPRFGLPAPDPSSWENPIELARRTLHFPLAELCLGIPLRGAPTEWTRLELSIELDQRWPSSLAVADQTFLLNAVVIENVVRRSAERIDVDGTRARHRIQHQEPSSGMKVREVLGVYVGDPDTPGARSALPPSALAGEGYTIEVEGQGPERQTWLSTDAVLGAPGAVERLYVEADWYSPDPVLPNAREAAVSIEDHDLGAMLWRLSDPVRPPRDSALLGDAGALDRLLGLHGRRIASVRDLELLLSVLGVGHSEALSRVPRYLERVESSFVPDGRAPSGGVRSYDLTLGKLPSVLVPAARLLFRLLPGTLGTWTGDTAVQVSVGGEALGPGSPWVFEWRASDDI